MPQNIGKLRHRLVLLKQVDKAAGQGTAKKVKQYFEVATRWGDALPVRGGEYFRTKNISEFPTHKFVIRFEQAFDNKSKITHIKHDDRVFEIAEGFPRRERKRFLDMKAIERGDAAVFTIVPLP